MLPNANRNKDPPSLVRGNGNARRRLFLYPKSISNAPRFRFSAFTMKPIIEVENLGKCYRLGRVGARSLRDELQNLRLRARGQLPKEDARDFWALKDVSFTVNEGEVLGIIGRNGAGKSTLLKLLSRITEPTTGRAILRGRVASLLEVGTGFHPELSGRENIFLNGAILGMTRREVAAKLDEIIDFAGIEKFLDTPVKRYSSGMYVRLAFAVAAHLEPEILIVDEVLAVGDAEFQRKCLGKMKDVSRGGRTVLFVSHQMPMIQHLCSRSIHIAGGEIVDDGETASVIQGYLSVPSARVSGARFEMASMRREASAYGGLVSVEIFSERDRPTRNVVMGGPLRVKIAFDLHRTVRDLGIGIGLEDSHGKRLMSVSNYMVNAATSVEARSGYAVFSIPELRLLAGEYWLTISLVEERRTYIDRCDRCASILVAARDVFGTGLIPHSGQGVTYAPAEVSICATQ